MKPSDEAQKVEPTNVQSAAASQTPSSSDRDAAGDAERGRTSGGTLRASSAASDEPMITVAAQAALGAATCGRARGERGGLEREQRGAAEQRRCSRRTRPGRSG